MTRAVSPVIAEHVGRQVAAGAATGEVDWDDALAAYNAVRPEHCRRVLTTGRACEAGDSAAPRVDRLAHEHECARGLRQLQRSGR